MTGGLLNIKAYGNQNIYIYGNPQKTFWTSTYKRITNFGLQNFRLDYEGLRQISTTNDTVFTFKVKRYADLLMDTMLVLTLPDIYSPIFPPTECTQGSIHGWVPYEFKWIKNIGAQIIKNIKITVGGLLLQEITGHQIVALANRDLNSTLKEKWDMMTGNINELYDPSNAFKRVNSYPNAIYSSAGAEPSIRGRQLFIPLPLWWCLNSQQAFPLISLQYNILQIEVTLRPLQELFQIRDVTDYDNNYPVVAPNFNLSEHQFYRFIQTPPNPELIYDSTIVNINMDIHLSCTYCFLDDQEQEVFALKPQYYLIRELRETWFYNVNTSDKVWLQNSTGMVLNWMILFQRSDVTSRNEWSNYTNWPYDYLPHDITLLPRLMENSPCSASYEFDYGINTDSKLIVPSGTLGYGLNPNGSDTGLYTSGDFNTENVKEILLTLGITLDGTYREEIKTSNIYKYQQQYLTSNGFGYSQLDGLYCYNFCLKTSPFDLQPSGCINLSKFSKIELEFTTIPPIIDPNANYLVICNPETGNQIGINKPVFQLYEYNYNMLVIEERYNMLTFTSGNVGLEYAR